MHTEQNNSKVAGTRWHAFREMARNEAFSPAEFSDAERVRFNLDSDDALSPAGVTGEDTDETYVGDAAGLGKDPEQDIREEAIR